MPAPEATISRIASRPSTSIDGDRRTFIRRASASMLARVRDPASRKISGWDLQVIEGQRPGPVGQKILARDGDDGRQSQVDQIKVGGGVKAAHDADLGLVIAQLLQNDFGVAGLDRDKNRGMLGAKGAHGLRDVQCRIRDDAQLAGNGPALPVQIGLDPLFHLEEGAGQAEQILARRGQGHLSSVAVEQQRIGGLFQPPDLFRQRRLGLVHRLGSARKSLVQRDMMKGAKLGVAHGGDNYIGTWLMEQ